VLRAESDGSTCRTWRDRDGVEIGCCPTGLVPSLDEKNKCECPSGGTLAAGCTPPVDTETFLSKVQVTMGAKFPAVRACYDKALVRRADLRGVIKIRFDIGPDGVPAMVRLVEGTIPDGDVQRCVLDTLRDTTFPPPPEGAWSVDYPLTFTEK
jgi:TonB family protein